MDWIYRVDSIYRVDWIYRVDLISTLGTQSTLESESTLGGHLSSTGTQHYTLRDFLIFWPSFATAKLSQKIKKSNKMLEKTQKISANAQSGYPDGIPRVDL